VISLYIRLSLVWRRKVDDALKFVVGREVDVTDTFRIGRYRPDKTRPIIVKLRSEWDKLLILRTSRKLKSYPDRIFVGPDEPIETRRKRTFERMKYRAERAGKRVSVINGVLSIDDIAVYSLVDGFLNNNHNG
jgi:hypothetical protein